MTDRHWGCRVSGHVRNRENRRQQHHENRSAHVATIGALQGLWSFGEISLCKTRRHRTSQLNCGLHLHLAKHSQKDSKVISSAAGTSEDTVELALYRYKSTYSFKFIHMSVSEKFGDLWAKDQVSDFLPKAKDMNHKVKDCKMCPWCASRSRTCS